MPVLAQPVRGLESGGPEPVEVDDTGQRIEVVGRAGPAEIVAVVDVHPVDLQRLPDRRVGPTGLLVSRRRERQLSPAVVVARASRTGARVWSTVMASGARPGRPSIGPHRPPDGQRLPGLITSSSTLTTAS